MTFVIIAAVALGLMVLGLVLLVGVGGFWLFLRRGGTETPAEPAPEPSFGAPSGRGAGSQASNAALPPGFGAHAPILPPAPKQKGRGGPREPELIGFFDDEGAGEAKTEMFTRGSSPAWDDDEEEAGGATEVFRTDQLDDDFAGLLAEEATTKHRKR